MGRRILLIDDEEVLAKNIKRYLDKRGFDTVIATTGSDGLQGFAKLVIDLVLLDINLPDVHGLTLVEGALLPPHRGRAQARGRSERSRAGRCSGRLSRS